MPYAKDMVRVWSHVPGPVNKELDKWAAKLGLTKSTLISLAVQSGLNSLIRSVSPEEAISPDTLAKIILAAQDQGKDLTLDDLMGKK
jgi:hypothetical protein